MADLPEGVDAATPFALGRFIAERIPAAVDKTNGTSMHVFFLPSLTLYNEVCIALVDSIQFRRNAVRPHATIEPVLVRVPS